MGQVLVLDANQRSALAIIRSLGRRNLNVVAGDHVANPLGSASRYAATSVRYADPAADPDRFVSEIIDIVNRLGIDTVVPATDLTTMLLLSQSNLPQNIRLAAPRVESYEALTDKARLIALAGEIGIAAPETRIARTADAIVDAAHDLGFPVVLKPARSRYLKSDHVRSTRVEIVRSPESLADMLQSLLWLADVPCLVQRFIPGHGAGVFVLYGPAGPIAWFAHRRLREKPPTGGVSVLCESTPIDPAMQSAASKLLAAVGWTGVAMVEFRVTADGTPYLMEVNGRFWGSLQLSIDCAVDFPWLLYQMTHDVPVAAQPPYTVGRRLRWLLGDFDSLLAELRGGRVGDRHRAQAVLAFLRSFVDSQCRQEVLRLHDPRPGVAEFAQWLRDLIR